MMRVGIDVGGTNTDAVLVDGERIVAGVKTPTTADVITGVRKAIADLSAAVGDDGLRPAAFAKPWPVNSIICGPHDWPVFYSIIIFSFRRFL